MIPNSSASSTSPSLSAPPPVPLPTLLVWARTAGLLYLLVAVLAGFSYAYVHEGLSVPGDPGATVANLLASESVLRFSFVCGLAAFACDIGVAVLLYALTRPAGPVLSAVAAAFRLVQTAILGLNMLNLWAAHRLAQGGLGLEAWEESARHALALLFVEAHDRGYDIGMVFFGIHCLLLGLLFIRSERFPGWLGVLMMAAAGGYLIDCLAQFFASAHVDATGMLVAVTAVAAELAVCFWLLIRGVRREGQDSPPPQFV